MRISSRLKEKYPEQMTVVLQHQFWDMLVTDQLFEIGLSFGDVPEKLTIPFAAIRGFYDPSVNFELEFDVSVVQPTSDNDEGSNISSIELISSEEAPAKSPKSKSRPRKTAAEKEDAAAKDKEATDNEETEPKPSADVVSLDSFRKK